MFRRLALPASASIAFFYHVDPFFLRVAYRSMELGPGTSQCNNPFIKKDSSEIPTARQPFLGKYDYEQKYPPDERYHELDENARIWHVYNDEAADFDGDIVSEFGNSLDVLLVFAALFASVLTTFVAQTSQSLSPDSAAISVGLLAEIAALQRAQASNSSISDIPSAPTTSIPASADIWVNGLWFVGLVLSLSTALLAVLAKQWLRQYALPITGTARQRTYVRHQRFQGLQTWKVREIIGLLPVLLHTSLFCFLCGLIVFLIPRNYALAAIVASLSGVLGAVYVVKTCLPVLYIFCQYRTPLSDLLYSIRKRPPRAPRNVKDAELASPLWSTSQSYHAGVHELTVDALFWLVKTSNKAQVCSLASQACGNLLTVENPADECRLKYKTLARPCFQALVTPHFGSKYPDEVKERYLRSRIVLHDLTTVSASKHQLDSLVETSDVTFALTLAVFNVPVRLQACGASFFIAPGHALEILIEHYTTASEMPQLPSRIWDALYATSLWRVPSCSPYTTVSRSFLRLLRDAVGSHVHTLAATQRQTTISDKPMAFNRYMQSHLIEAGWLCRNDIIVNMRAMVRPLVRRLPGSDDAFDDPCDDVQDDGLSIHASYPGDSGVESAANTYKHLPVVTSIATARGLQCGERTFTRLDAQGIPGGMTVHGGGGLYQLPSTCERVAPLELPKSFWLANVRRFTGNSPSPV